MKRLASLPALILIYLIAIALLATYALDVEPGELFLAVIDLSLIFSPLLIFVAVVAIWQRRKRVFTATNATGPLGPELMAEHDGQTIKARPPRRFMRPAFLGAVMVVCGFGSFFGVNHWVLRPVDIPVSLKPGTIRTPAFRILTQSEYTLRLVIDVEDENDYRCPTHPDWEHRSIVKARWTVFHNGQPYASQMFDFDRYHPTAIFSATPGKYAVEVQVLADASCLQKYHPHLMVDAAEYSDLRDSFLFGLLGESPFPILCGAAGVAMLALALYDRRRSMRATVGVAGVEHVGPVIYRPNVYRPLRPKFGGMPAFGTIGPLVVFCVLVTVWIGFSLQPITEGFVIRVSSQDYVRALQNPSVGPLVISVTRNKKSVLYAINDEEVALDHLHDALKQELGRRAEWVVFVEGDEDLPYQDIVQLIDIANGLHAKVVMLTPGMKQGH